MITDAELAKRFSYHPPNPTTVAKYGGMREFFKGLAEHIIDTTPESREQSLALTHLEEAMFWANAAIARNT